MQDSIVLNSILTLPKTKNELLAKSYVDSGLKDPSIIRYTTYVDYNNKNLDNVRFDKVNSSPAVREHLTTKFYLDEAICHNVDEIFLSKLDTDEKLKLNEQDSIILNSNLTSLKFIKEIPTKPYVENLHKSIRIKRDLSSVINDQDNEFDNIILNKLESVTFNGRPVSDNELTTKKCIDNEIGENTILTFNRTLQIYLKVSVGVDRYDLAKYD